MFSFLFGEQEFFGWIMEHTGWQDGTDDYAERVYIYNTQAFKISDEASFIVTPSGEKRIENFAIEPLITTPPDNFDFESSSFLGSLGNPLLSPF